MTVVETPTIVRSSLLDAVPGLVHGFTTREMGSMAGSIFPAEEQARHRAALERAIGMPLAKASQVHGADVAIVAAGRANRAVDGLSEPIASMMQIEADALITRDKGLALAVAVADCVPVLVVTPEGWIGIAHAGWEGLCRGVIPAMLSALAPLRGSRAVIGPSIGPCCYEIDGNRARAVRERLGRLARRVLYPRGERYRLDLWLAVRLQLRERGVDAVDSMDLCVRDRVGRFFSHRGEQGRAGRGLAFIGWSK